MKKISIFPLFEPDLPASEKYRLIKNANFTAVNIYWGDNDKHEQVQSAKENGLTIDCIHSANDNPNAIWEEGADGDARKNVLLACVEDCAQYGVPTVAVHLTGFPPYPPVTELGLQRLAEIVHLAEEKNVKLAFENLWTFEHLDAVFERFPSQNVGFCYDSGHENLNPHKDCLAAYGHRLFALHINDNFADGFDAHVLSFDGTINWDTTMARLNKCKNIEFLTLEIYKLEKGEHEKSCIYKGWSASEFLSLAYQRAVSLKDLGASS